MARSTVGLVLRRLGLGRLTALDPKPQVIRYERAMPKALAIWGPLILCRRSCSIRAVSSAEVLRGHRLGAELRS